MDSGVATLTQEATSVEEETFYVNKRLFGESATYPQGALEKIAVWQDDNSELSKDVAKALDALLRRRTSNPKPGSLAALFFERRYASGKSKSYQLYLGHMATEHKLELEIEVSRFYSSQEECFWNLSLGIEGLVSTLLDGLPPHWSKPRLVGISEKSYKTLIEAIRVFGQKNNRGYKGVPHEQQI